MNACLFCRIAAKALPASVVYEDEGAIAFLDHRPLFPGHVLVVPRQHVETLLELPGDQVGPLFAVTQHLGRAVQEAMKADGFLLAVNTRVSQSVPHLHIHLVPRKRGDGLKGFFWPRHPYRDDAHREEVRSAIAQAAGGGPSP